MNDSPYDEANGQIMGLLVLLALGLGIYPFPASMHPTTIQGQGPCRSWPCGKKYLLTYINGYIML